MGTVVLCAGVWWLVLRGRLWCPLLALFFLFKLPFVILHALELVNALFGVSGADLPQSFVLVPPCPHVFCMDEVVLGLLRVVPSVSQL